VYKPSRGINPVIVIKTQISILVHTARFWNNVHPLCSNKSIWEQ
jgi:hypothetical protein